jgi:ABC-type phosphate/phosphonate transport system substrate-binding protein
MVVKWLFNPCLSKARLGGGISMFILLMGLMLWAAGSSHAGQSNLSTSSPYLYPDVLCCGVLNALNGVNQRDAQVAIEMNFDRLRVLKNPDFRVKLAFLPDAAMAAKSIEQRKLHLIAITGIEFIRLRSLVGVTPIAVSSKVSESPLEPYVLLSRKGISFDDLMAMDQRRLIVESNKANHLGRVWLETALHEKGLPRSTAFFTSFEVAAKPTRMVLPVFFGQAEACLVPKSTFDTMVELNPQVGQKLQTLIQSPGFIQNLVCIADYLAPQLVTEIKKTMLTMSKTESGRQLMVIFQIQRNFIYKPEYLIETERIFKKYQKIMHSRP